MKKHRYLQTFFDTDGTGVSRPKYEAGKDYEISEETARHVALRYAEEVEVPDAVSETAADADTLRQVATGTDAPQDPADTGEASDAAPAAPTRGRGRAAAAA